MDAIAWIAEQKITEAIKAGEFDNLPGQGKPLLLDDDWYGPSRNRLAFKILKNAGYLPLTLQLRKEIEEKQGDAETLLRECARRLRLLSQQIHSLSQGRNLRKESRRYRKRVPESVGHPNKAKSEVESQPEAVEKAERLLRLERNYNCTIDGFRTRYKAILSEIGHKIAELNYHCIRDETQRNLTDTSRLMWPAIDIKARLRDFDSRFERIELPNTLK